MTIPKRSKAVHHSAEFVKSPLQLQQWAAYEELTAQRALQVTTKVDHGRQTDELLDQAMHWRQAMDIRAFVAQVISRLPPNSDPSTIRKAQQWQEWALNTADGLDQSEVQAKSFKCKS